MINHRRVLCVALLGVMLALALRPPAATAQEADVAMRFFSDGGAYCFRIAPEGTNLSEEGQWRIMLLTGTSNRRDVFRIRTVDPGRLRISGDALKDLGMSITGVWRRERIRDEFFEDFANGIRRGVTRARVTTVVPPRLARMSRTERAEFYLDFADKGSRIDFGGAPDLTAEEFLAYQTYVPD
jgi:hypothetical protein